MMRKIALAGLASLLLAGCAAEPGVDSSPASADSPPAEHRPKPGPSADQCGAEAAQHLVGRPRTEIPVPVQPALQRVACTTCPVTMDFNPRRLNFYFEASTGTIKEIRCG